MQLQAKTQSYVTSVGNDEEALQALVWSRSIRRSLSSRKVSVIVSDTVSSFLRLMLENEFDYVFGVTSESLKEYGKSYLKYSCWKMKLWTKCVYISPSSLVLENCDHLFDLANFSVLAHESAANGLRRKATINLFVYEPDMKTFDQCLKNHKQVIGRAGGSLDELEDFMNIEVEAFKMQKWKYLSLATTDLNNSGGDPKLLFNLSTGVSGISVSLMKEQKWNEILFEDVLSSLNGLGEVNGLRATLDKLLNSLGVTTPKSGGLSNRRLIDNDLLDDTVAIIGMSCRFPGANNPDEFWEMLAAGRDGITSFPFERLSPREKSTAIPPTYDCGFLKCPVDEFDARFFGMSPREAQFVDPQQRLLLEVAWEALENAGINPLSLKGSKTSAYVGIHMLDYERIIKPVGAQEYHHSYLGNCFSATASRISYFLGLVGPNVAIEAGCASSMVGVHLACESLKRGDSSLSLASGVNLILKRNEKSGSTLMAVLSPDCRSKTFDESANGFARAEGCGTLVLKRLGDALRSGDNVIALIRGSAINNDGPGQSFGTPSAASQERVVREALLSAGLNPAEVGYVEAHGTGTPVGDPLEFQGLAKIYATPGRKEPLMIGSVKTNIGHTESAAGIAGIIKVILCMRKKAISPHLHLNKLSPRIDLSLIPAKIPTCLTEWSAATKIAGVSSFSMSGTSTHAIIQEAPLAITAPRQKESTFGTGELQLVTMSAKTEKSLENVIAKYADYLSQNPNTSLEDLAYTLNQCRAHFAYRTTILASNMSELQTSLQNRSYTIQQVPSTGRNKIGLLFTGQGSQYFGMGKSLYETSLPFRVALDQVAVLFESYLHKSLRDVLWHDEALLSETIYCQPAIFCIEYALAQHWMKLGLRPDYVLGHSIGEFSAAVCVGLLFLEDAMKLVVERSRLVNTLPKGRMLVLKTSQENARSLIKRFEDEHKDLNGMDIAAINSSTEIVVSGTIESIDAFEEYCVEEKVRMHKLAASHAFHSRQMDPVLREFEAICKSVTYNEISEDVSYISGTYAKRMKTSDFEGSPYWSDHLRHTVNFAKAVKLMSKSGCNVFLETGPQPVLLGLAMGNVDYSASNVFCFSMKSKEQDWTLFMNTLSKLYLAGISVDLNALYKAHGRPNRLQLPTYAFDRQKFWFVDEEDTLDQDVHKINKRPVHPILGTQMRTPFSEQLYTSKLSVRHLEYLGHHKVCNHIILPGAALLEASLAVGKDILNGDDRSPLMVRDLQIAAALPLQTNVLLETVVKIRNEQISHEGVQYEISFMRPTLNDTWKHHATALFTPGASLPEERTIDVEATKAKLQFKNEDRLTGLYKKMASMGLEFGSSFQSILRAWTSPTEILAQLELPQSQSNEAAYICHPIVLDAMIQTFAFGFALNEVTNEDGNASEDKSLRLPFAIRKFIWLAKPLTATLYAHASIGTDDAESGDVALYDEFGNCVAIMAQLELVKVRPDTFERNLIADRTPLPGFYTKIWKPLKDANNDPTDGVAVEQNSDQAKVLENSFDKVVILFNTSSACGYDSEEFLKKLSVRLSEKRRLVIIVNHSNSPQMQRPCTDGCQALEFKMDFRSKSHFEDVYALIQAEVGKTASKKLEGMFYFCTGNGSEESEMEEIRRVSCSGLLNLCQTIFHNAKGDDQSAEAGQKLVVVTKGAWNDEEPGCPDNAPAWGVMKNFCSEHQLVDAKIIDLGLKEEVDGTVDQLLSSFWRMDGEKFLAVRDGTTYTERLRNLPNTTTPLIIPSVDRYTVVVPSTGTISDLQVSPCNRKPVTGSHVEVAVRAVSLNFHDLMTVLKPEGFHEATPSAVDDHIGMDFSGVIAAVGSDVKNWAVGDEVIGLTTHGFQSHVVIHEKCLMPKRKHVTFAGASTIPCVFMTSYYALEEMSNISAKDRVLIHVGTGGVGLSAIQIAKTAGAEIYTTAGTKRKREYLSSVLGLRNVYNSRNTDYGEQIMRDTKGGGVTIVLNSLTGPNFKETSLACCAPGASFVEIGKINTWTEDEIRTLRPDVKYTIVDLYPRIIQGEKDDLLLKYMDKIIPERLEDGIITELPRTTFALERIRDAFGYLQKARHVGKIVVKMPQPGLRLDTGKFSLTHEYFDAESTYLITGGLGGIGIEVTKWMAGTGAKHVVLVSRNGPTPQTAEMLDDVRSTGCNIVTWRADVSNYDECRNLLEKITSSTELPPLRGIFLSTGTISDGLISNQTWEKYQLSFKSKVDPAWNLHNLTQGYDLDFFTMFSSMSSSIGTAAQSNYSAACSYQDSLTKYRLAKGMVGATINWGAWSDIGQASNARMGMEGLFGFKAITAGQGIRALEEFLNQNLTAATIMEIGDWNRLHATLNNGNFLADVIVSREDAYSKQDQERLWKLVEDSANDNERQLNLEAYLEHTIRSMLKLSASDTVDRDQELSELGVDSLTAMELRNHLQKMLGNKVVTVNALQENRNIKKLAAYLASLLNTGATGNGSRASLTELVGSDCVLPSDITISTDTLPPVPKSEFKTIFLTGATGFLGSHIVHDILTKTKMRVICLLRAESTEEALERLTKTFVKYGLPVDNFPFERLTFALGDIIQDNLGLVPEEYDSVALSADAIIHCAAKMHLLELYTMSDRPNCLRRVNRVGLTNVLRLAVARKVKSLFHPSYLTVSTTVTKDGYLTERFPTVQDYTEELQNGYVISKFVQEVLISQLAELGVPCTVLRFAGLWGNESSSKAHKQVFTHVGSFLKACLAFRKFPMFHVEESDENNDGLPVTLVDAATEAMVHILQRSTAELGVYNYINNLDESNVVTKACLEELMREHGLEFEFLEPRDWRDAVFNEHNEKINFLLPFKYLYEDTETGLRIFEAHPLIKENRALARFDTAFMDKLRRNLPDLPPARLTAKEIMKFYYDDILKN